MIGYEEDRTSTGSNPFLSRFRWVTRIRLPVYSSALQTGKHVLETRIKIIYRKESENRSISRMHVDSSL